MSTAADLATYDVTAEDIEYQRIDGEPLLAIDKLGCGQGDRVILSNDGLGARELVGARNSPVRWLVLGLCDR